MVLEKKPMLLKNLAANGITGSHSGMQYYICQETDKLVAYTYPEPFSFSCTAPEYKTRSEFTWDDAGYSEALNWINTQYTERINEWNVSKHYSILDAPTHI